MDCTVVCTSHGAWAVQSISQHWLLMGHGLYSGVSAHGSLTVQSISQHLLPMGHGLYSSMTTHGPWTVQWGVYPWVMDCTVHLKILSTHRSWTVQWHVHPMAHGLCSPSQNIGCPCTMDRTRVCPSHGSWAVAIGWLPSP